MILEILNISLNNSNYYIIDILLESNILKIILNQLINITKNTNKKILFNHLIILLHNILQYQKTHKLCIKLNGLKILSIDILKSYSIKNISLNIFIQIIQIYIHLTNTNLFNKHILDNNGYYLNIIYTKFFVFIYIIYTNFFINYL